MVINGGSAQQALAPDAAPLRFAAQVKRKPLGGYQTTVLNGIQKGVEL